MSAREMVRQFEEATGGVVRDVPTALSRDELELRTTLLCEELAELVCALAGLAKPADEELAERFHDAVSALLSGAVDRQPADLAAVAKELADVEVVLHGTAWYSGVDLDLATAEVHRSNMTKLDGPKRPDGKVLKGPNYEPPDPARLLAQSPGPVLIVNGEIDPPIFRRVEAA